MFPHAENTDTCTWCGGRAQLMFVATDRNRMVTSQRFRYRRCVACETISLVDTPDDLAPFYPNTYYRLPRLDQLDDLARWEDYKIACIRPHVTAGRLVEIGPGPGLFAYAAKLAGYEVTAIEMDARAAGHIRDTIGVAVLNSDNPEAALAQLPPSRAVALWHVLEHLRNPVAVLRAAAANLEPGGVLALATPNPDAVQFRLLRARWTHIDAPRHLFLIPLDTVTRELARSGMRRVSATSSDPGGRYWNAFGWERSLFPRGAIAPPPRSSAIAVRRLARVMAPIEGRGLRGSTYTALFVKNGDQDLGASQASPSEASRRGRSASGRCYAAPMLPRSDAAPQLTDLDAMWAEMEQAPRIVQPSDFWRGLNERNVRQIADEGFERFKRTVNQNYFSWIPHTLADDQLRAMARAWLRHPKPAVLTAHLGDVSTLEAGAERVNPFADDRARRIHGIFLALLWEYVRRHDRLGILTRLQEPTLGDPVIAQYRGRRISQDLGNSVYEFYSATAGLPRGDPGAGGALELGGGYGRVAWVFLEQFPESRYILCDIPPALAIAQQYLTALFPERATFRFRRFSSHDEVADELAAAKIVFLTPNQLDLLEPLRVSLFVNISSLHEMRPEQIAYYIRQADRHTNGFFYTKQWECSHNPDDDIVISRPDYPIPSHWETLYERRHPIQRAFFHALYATRKMGAPVVAVGDVSG